MGGHFSSNEALAADFATKMFSSDVAASTANLTNSIVFSAGCHAGYNLLDPDAITGVSQPVDLAQAFARKRRDADRAAPATSTATTSSSNTASGSTPSSPTSCGSARGPVPLGQALIKSKQIYLSSTPDIRVLHAKSILQTALYGLPMLSVNMPAGRVPAPTTSTPASRRRPSPAPPATNLGLQSALTCSVTTPTPGLARASQRHLPVRASTGSPSTPARRSCRSRSRTSPWRQGPPRASGSAAATYTDTPGVTPVVSDVSTLIGARPAGVQLVVLRPGPGLAAELLRCARPGWRHHEAAPACRPSTRAMAQPRKPCAKLQRPRPAVCSTARSPATRPKPPLRRSRTSRASATGDR